MEKALKIMCGKKRGFVVMFEHKRGAILELDHFPEGDERLIYTEEKAWELARAFAKETKGSCVNIYIADEDFITVKNYKDNYIENR
jgi:hypothetical protein